MFGWLHSLVCLLVRKRMSRILIVSHQFLPHQSPRTTRWKMIYDELISRGHEVVVLTGTPQEDIKENIVYVGNKNPEGVVENLRKGSNKSHNSSLLNIGYRFLKLSYRFLYKTFSWPDYSMFWLISILRSKKNLNINYDYIISVSLPFSSHVAAYIVNRKNKKKWIMDIGDPFLLKKNARENNHLLYFFLNKYFETKFYNSAYKILFTHKESLDNHSSYFKIDKEKLIVGKPISNFNEEIHKLTLSYDYSAKPVIFGYFGVLTKGVRSSENVLNYIEEFEHFKFKWFTNPDSKIEINKHMRNYQNHEFLNMVPRSEALKIMSTSVHCLLSIGNKNSSQLPSKVVEYISTGKPVIHFAEINNDPVIEISKRYPNLLVISRNLDKHEFIKKLDDLFDNIDRFSSTEFLDEYSPNTLVNQLDFI